MIFVFLFQGLQFYRSWIFFVFLVNISLSVSLKLTLPFQRASQVTLVIKKMPANARDTRELVQSLSWEDPLEKGIMTQSSILAWKIPWREEPRGVWSIGSQSQR